MPRFLPLPSLFIFTAVAALAAETAPPTAVPAPAAPVQATTTAAVPTTLAALEAEPRKESSDPAYRATEVERTLRAITLIESNALTTADEFFRASKQVTQTENEFRGTRVRYELLAAASALGNADAERELGAAWDQLMSSLGRPMRIDAAGLTQKYSDSYELDSAPDCVQLVLRDPAKARAAAKTTQRNGELKKIVDADQTDRRSWDKLKPDEMKAVGERDHARNARTREIIHAGELHTASDFANASLVMQHSPRFEGYRTAHELALCSMLLGDRGSGRWLVAATYDRMLDSVGHDQRFGTQYFSRPNGAMTLAPIDLRGTCDAERRALGCPTLDEAKGRTAEQSKPDATVAEFNGPNGTIHDPKFGLTAKLPTGWTLAGAGRWGDQQQTLFFEPDAAPDAQPALYYKIYRVPQPMAESALAQWYRDEMVKKQVQRRESGMTDYTNRADSLKSLTLGANAVVSWSADYTSSDGDKWTEYMVDLRTAGGNAFFFLRAPADQIDKLQPAVDAFMGTLNIPEPK
jgi:hypothetical protein